MEITKTALDNLLREKYVENITSMLQGAGEQVLKISGNVIALPTTDDAGNESWIEITVKVPKGERLSKEDGGGFAGYDGYNLSEFYKTEQVRKADELAQKKANAEIKKSKSSSKKKIVEVKSDTEGEDA